MFDDRLYRGVYFIVKPGEGVLARVTAIYVHVCLGDDELDWRVAL